MSRGLNVEKGQKEGVRDSLGSLSITINWLAVMTVFDKSLGEESLRAFRLKPHSSGPLKKQHGPSWLFALGEYIRKTYHVSNSGIHFHLNIWNFSAKTHKSRKMQDVRLPVTLKMNS